MYDRVDEPPTKLIQPRQHKAKVVLWADLTVSDIDRINDAITPDQVRGELADILHIEVTDGDSNDMKNAILLDLYYYTINFCRQLEFSKEQTSAFFSIVKKTHEVCVETPFGNVHQCFCYFKEMLLCHAVKRPPYSMDLFNADQVRAITDYVINTYFRHFKMYKYAFTPLVRLDLSMTYVGMPDTPVPSEAGEEAGGDDAESGHGDQQEMGDAVAETETEEGQGQETGTDQEQQQKEEESVAAKELRILIKGHLAEELKTLKGDIDSQIKDSETVINQKLVAVENSAPGKGSRPKHSAKTKRK